MKIYRDGTIQLVSLFHWHMTYIPYTRDTDSTIELYSDRRTNSEWGTFTFDMQQYEQSDPLSLLSRTNIITPLY